MIYRPEYVEKIMAYMDTPFVKILFTFKGHIAPKSFHISNNFAFMIANIIVFTVLRKVSLEKYGNPGAFMI